MHAPLWRLPTWDDYVRLRGESEYAAWVIYNRYYLNHFTISVHALPPGHDELSWFNEFLKRIGVELNDAGGEIKNSSDGLLLQSSTVAQVIEAEFAGGERHPIPGSYVEFAERRPLPEYRDLPRESLRREHRREGFEASNANRIFESTFDEQTARRRPK